MARIGLVAHDKKKADLVEWVQTHRAILEIHTLFATGTTGSEIVRHTGLSPTLLKSGPLGGDAQIGAMIVEDRLDMLVFFIDPLTAMPHDVDVKALIRLAVLEDLPIAVNRSTANALIATIG